MSDPRPTVLVLLGCFRRGHEATGPNQSMIGMARTLGDRFRFRVIADVPGTRETGWTEVAGVEQRALPQGRFGAKGLREAIRTTPHDLLVMNSIFDRQLTIPALAMRRLGLIPRTPALLAPRGEFSPGALALKSPKKRLHLAAVRKLGLLDDVSLQATSDDEAAKIRSGFPSAGRILVGPNVRALPPLPRHAPRGEGEKLRIAFLGRIVAIKNLDFALAVLAEARVPARFDIFGPIEDREVWARCLERIERMPGAVEVHHRGLIAQADVFEALAGYDLLFLPSGGENFGHAIFEALAAGTPVLISDQTPWRGLDELGAGWDLPLGRVEPFAEAIRACDAWTAEERGRRRLAARSLAEARLSAEGPGARLAQCLENAMAAGGRSAEPGPIQPVE